MVAAKQKQISVRTALVAGALALAAVASGRWPAALGVLVGSLVALVTFRLLARSIHRLLSLTDPGAASVGAFVGYCARYALYIGVLYAVTLNPEVDFFATVVGILLIKVVIVSEAVFQSLKIHIQKTIAAAWGERGD